jgi:hypothetical protein
MEDTGTTTRVLIEDGIVVMVFPCAGIAAGTLADGAFCVTVLVAGGSVGPLVSAGAVGVLLAAAGGSDAQVER